MANRLLKLFLIIISLVNIVFINSIENLRTEEKQELRLLTSALICPSGSFGISWYSTYLTGKHLSLTTDTNNICLVSETGIAKYKASYNIITCWAYGSACGGDKTSDVKRDICESYSKYEKNTIGADRIIYSQIQKPKIEEIKEFGKTVNIVVADLGNSNKLHKFYDSLPTDCKKHLDLTFDI